MSLPPIASFSHYPITKIDLDNLNRTLKIHTYRSSSYSSFTLNLTFYNQENTPVYLDIREKKQHFSRKDFNQVLSIHEKIVLAPGQSKQVTAIMQAISKRPPFVFQKELELHILSKSIGCIECISSVNFEVKKQASFSVILKKVTLPGILSEETYISASLEAPSSS